MKFKQRVKIFIVGILLLMGAWVALNWDHLRSFPGILPSFTAKEFCTCYFVNEQGEDYCKEVTRQWYPIRKLEIDNEKKIVRVSGSGSERSAHFVDNQTGCQLDAL